jgi:hypothetical protein
VNGFELRRITVDQDHIRLMTPARERHGAADAGARAGDGDYTTGELGGAGNVVTRLKQDGSPGQLS